MKKVMALLIALLLLLVCSACSNQDDSSDSAGSGAVAPAVATKVPRFASVAVGDVITFGTYEQDNNPDNGPEPNEWVVLDVKDRKALVISKEGHTEGVKLLLSIKYLGKELDINHNDVYKACGIPMPTDQKRNMMNASSNFDIIFSILSAIREKKAVKIHTPGVDGHIGGYPFIIDGTHDDIKGYFDPMFLLDEMEKVNRKSIYCDGIEDVVDGCLVYTDELINKVMERFNIRIPKKVKLNDAESLANLFISNIIEGKMGGGIINTR